MLCLQKPLAEQNCLGMKDLLYCIKVVNINIMIIVVRPCTDNESNDVESTRQKIRGSIQKYLNEKK